MRLMAALDPYADMPIMSGSDSYTTASEQVYGGSSPVVMGGIPELALFQAKIALSKIEGYAENWDGMGSARPSVLAAQKAYSLLESFYGQVQRSSTHWSQPHVGANERGSIVLEWWKSERKLTVCVGERETYFLKVWGDRIDEDMEDGEMTEEEFLSVWHWLNG
jgi:hypothetical protein